MVAGCVVVAGGAVLSALTGCSAGVPTLSFLYVCVSPLKCCCCLCIVFGFAVLLSCAHLPVSLSVPGDVDIFLVAPPPNEEQVVLSKIYDIAMGAPRMPAGCWRTVRYCHASLSVAGLGVLGCLQRSARRQRAPAGNQKPRRHHVLQASRRAAAGHLEHIQEPLGTAVVVRRRCRMLRIRAQLRHIPMLAQGSTRS